MQTGRVPNFKPSVNGFRFENFWDQGIPVTDITIAGLGVSPFKLPVGDASAGACGGMCYAVADFFLAQPRLYIPTNESSPGKGDPLTDFIMDRFMDSFALWKGLNSNAAHFLDLMSTLDHDTWTAHGVPWVIANQEWPEIKADIDAGLPSSVGLVPGSWVWPTNVSAKIGLLKHCHVVLAYAYELDDASNLTLWVYDPNDVGAGRDESTISMNISMPSQSATIAMPRILDKGSVVFRAFFHLDYYTPVLPPVGLSPGPFALSVAIIPADPIAVDKPVVLTVTATDQTTGLQVSAEVWADNNPIGATDSAITHTFRATWHRQKTVNRMTGDIEWHWVGPHYPRVTVIAENYDRVDVPVKFVGGEKPPPDPIDDLF